MKVIIATADWWDQSREYINSVRHILKDVADEFEEVKDAASFEKLGIRAIPEFRILDNDGKTMYRGVGYLEQDNYFKDKLTKLKNKIKKERL